MFPGIHAPRSSTSLRIFKPNFTKKKEVNVITDPRTHIHNEAIQPWKILVISEKLMLLLFQTTRENISKQNKALEVIQTGGRPTLSEGLSSDSTSLEFFY